MIILWLGIGLGILSWFIEPALHAFALRDGNFIEQLYSEPGDVWSRSSNACLIIALCATAQALINRRKRAEEGMLRAQQELREAFEGTVKSLSISIDAQSPWTHGHSVHVAMYVTYIARAIGLDDELTKKLELAGLLHDIGKLGPYLKLLEKPEKLMPEEQQLVEEHPSKAVEILATWKWFEDILPSIRHHHEHWDGTGYPDKLKGDRIPLGARILAVADAYEAMTSDRPYRKALSHTQVMAELIRNKGIQFDPRIVNAFVRTNIPLAPASFR